jgi:hypothetical protein
MLDEYLTIRSQFLNITPFFGWSEEMWSGNNYKNNKILVSNFFKATKGAWWMPWV